MAIRYTEFFGDVGDGGGRLLGWSSSQIELAKWLGLVLMLGDHMEKYVLMQPDGPLTVVGRLAFPLFALAFAAGWGLDTDDARMSRLRRLAVRCSAWGILAVVPNYLATGVWGANMLFVFPLAVFVSRWMRLPGVWSWMAAVSLVVGGAVLAQGAYDWRGVLMVWACLAAVRCWWWLLVAGLLWVSTMALWMVPWALVGLLVVGYGIGRWRGEVARLPRGGFAALYVGQWVVVAGMKWAWV